jgi:hypothetical protein
MIITKSAPPSHEILQVVIDCAKAAGVMPTDEQLIAVSGMVAHRPVRHDDDEADTRFDIVTARIRLEEQPDCPVVNELFALYGVLKAAQERHDSTK